jgi:hypothetical protein
MKPPVIRQPISTDVVLVVLDVDVLVLLELLEVELLVLLDVEVEVDELVLLEVDELVEVELLVLLDVLELDELLELVELLVLELVELLVLLDVLVLVDVLVVVVITSVPRSFSERNGWSVGASCSRPSVRVSTGPDWSPARASATASNTPGLTLSVHICVPPTGVAGVPAGRLKFVVMTTGFAKSGVPSAAGQ